MPKTSAKFRYGEDDMTLAALNALTDNASRGVLTASTRARVKAGFHRVAQIVASGKTVYGVNTGFGPLCTKGISASQTQSLQENLLRSHSVGVGNPITPRLAKMMLILKIHSLAKGFSGIAPATLDRLVWHVDNEVLPEVPEQGSVGASGDLAPLAHLFLPLIGLGKVHCQGKWNDAGSAIRRMGLKPLKLGPKEGLALINGTQFIAACAADAAIRMQRCLDVADIAGTMSLEALMGSASPFQKNFHTLRPHPGSIHVASRIRALLRESEIITSHLDCGRVQDPYSLRCLPQVHGASRDGWLHLKESLHCEFNSVTDNPIVFPDGSTVSGGHFHGQPLALPIDYATLAASEIGSISDRRIYLLMEGKTPGLPAFLTSNPGLHSGFMIMQYASAALASENKTSCFPASADSIPTSNGQEDHVSMGSIGARRLGRIVNNLESLLAIELICAAQGLDFRFPLRTGPILQAVHRELRRVVRPVKDDRVMADDIKTARNLIFSGTITAAARAAATKHGINLNGDDHERYGLH